VIAKLDLPELVERMFSMAPPEDEASTFIPMFLDKVEMALA